MNAPTNRALHQWWDEQTARLGADAQLTCADCGRVDAMAYVQPQHPFWADGRDDVARCGTCIGVRQAAARARRKEVLAARPQDCARCGARPHTFVYGGHKLCGRCLTATRREHGRAMANAGTLAIFATSLLVDTSAWAANGRHQEETR